MLLKVNFFNSARPVQRPSREKRDPSPDISARRVVGVMAPDFPVTGAGRGERFLKKCSNGVFGIAATALILTACSPSEPAPMEPATDTAPTEAPSLPLPPFPTLPAPVTSLSADASGLIYFSTKSPYDFTRVLHNYDQSPDTTGMGTLVMPEGASVDNPVPAIVILHGSGGIQKGREHEYAKLFADNGIAGFVVDYYAPRGVTEDTPYTMKTMAATEIDIMADAYAALKLLDTHPAIDGSRIGVTGYSYGAMATRYVMDDRVQKIMGAGSPPFALHMSIYGPCHQTTGHSGTTGAPYLTIYGDADNSVDPAACIPVHADIRAAGSSVEEHIIKGAGHAWENDAPIGEFGGAYIKGCTFSFDSDSGAFLVNGEAGFTPEPDMTRGQRAMVRAGLGQLVGGCIGQGYTVGNNPEADKQSKAIQLEFMKRVFELD